MPNRGLGRVALRVFDRFITAWARSSRSPVTLRSGLIDHMENPALVLDGRRIAFRQLGQHGLTSTGSKYRLVSPLSTSATRNIAANSESTCRPGERFRDTRAPIPGGSTAPRSSRARSRASGVEIMGDVAGDLTQIFDQPFNSVEHPVEGRRELVELVLAQT